LENEIERLIESRTILYMLANGLNPADGTSLDHESLFNDSKIIRSLFFLVDHIDSELTEKGRKHRNSFHITDVQKSMVNLPEGKIGIKEFAKAINEVIDPKISKKINGTLINKQLKKMGILNELKTEEGSIRTITNEKSEGYGIISEIRTFNNRTYEKVLFTDIGKQFLLENIENILKY
jgi:hypothetical protein